MRRFLFVCSFLLLAGVVSANPEKLAERDRLLKELNTFLESNNVSEALAVAESVLKIEREVLGDSHADVFESLRRVALLNEHLGRYEPAKKHWEILVTLKTKHLGAGHWQVTDAKLAAANSEILGKLNEDQRKKLDEAKVAYSQAIAMYQRGRYEDAIPHADKAVITRKAILGGEHPDYASALNTSAMILLAKGRHMDAEARFREARLVREKVLGKNHPDYATSLNNLASLYDELGRPTEAEPLLTEAIRVHLAAYGKEHPVVATDWNNLASHYEQRGLYSKAEPLYRETLRIRKAVLGEKHYLYAASLNNLGLHYKIQGDYTKAEPYYRDAVRIEKAVLGEAHPVYAISLNNLAGLYASQGKYALAEPLYLQVLAIRKAALGVKHALYADSLNNLAIVLTNRGLYDKAEEYYREAIEIRKSTSGDKHSDYAHALNSLAVLFWSQDQPEKAAPLLEQALAILKATLGAQHPVYAANLNNLALIYKSQQRYDQAEAMYLEAIEIYRSKFGEKHPDYASGLNNLALLYKTQSKWEKATELYESAMSIRKESLGERHPSYAQSLHNLAAIYKARGRFSEAEGFYRRALQVLQDHLEESASYQSEADQLRHVAVSRLYLDNYLVLPHADPSALYAAVLRWHGAITARQILARAARWASPEIRAAFAELRDIARLLNRYTQNPPKGMPAAELTKILGELNERRDTLEKLISGQSQEFASIRNRRRFTPAELQKLLPEGTALVDFLVHGVTTSAFVITKDTIVRVSLDTGKELAEEIQSFTSDLSLSRTRPVTNPKDVSVKLRQRIWEPLTEHFGKVYRVLLCPDGPLCRLPFGVLPGSDPKKYLIEEVATIIVPVPQLLPGLLASEPPRFDGGPGLLAVGNVDFNCEIDKQAGTPDEAALRSNGQVGWSKLPHTKAEVETIAALFHTIEGSKVKQLYESEANASAIETELPRHRFAHLATHGFFDTPKITRQLHDEQMLGKRQPAALPPGLASGIVCAGANKPSPQNSGILTATEIAELDLRSMECVVLSACETGLGELATSEGVLGLQRAFLLAGSRTTVSSLWAIPDRATGELMKQFYANRLVKKMSAIDSLREAQLWALNHGEEIGAFDAPPRPGKRSPPQFWAAFTLSGDWR